MFSCMHVYLFLFGQAALDLYFLAFASIVGACAVLCCIFCFALFRDVLFLSNKRHLSC